MTVKNFKLKLLTVLLVGLFTAVLSGRAATAKIIREDNNALCSQLALPIHRWRDDSVTPKAVVIAIHGLTLHGTLFDTYARHLAASGIIVVAPDLRGYGDWFQCDKKATISYTESERDLGELVNTLHKQYGDLPLFCSGESLGGAMTIRLAATNPDWFDGIILSAPAIRMSRHVPIKTVLSSLILLVEPKHKIDLTAYLQQCTETDGGSWNVCNDALVRSHLTLSELRSSVNFIESTDRYVSAIPSTMPVLIIQGKQDHVLNHGGLRLLERHLNSIDQTIQVFEDRGHILLERKDIPDDTFQTISCWLDKHCDEARAREIIATRHESTNIALLSSSAFKR